MIAQQSLNESRWRGSHEATRARIGVGLPRVIVADDDAELRADIAAALLDDGYEVYQAGSVGELLRCVPARAGLDDGADLLLMSDRIAGYPGLHVLRRLRARADLQIVLMVGNVTRGLVREASGLLVPTLPKPFSLELLSDVVRTELLFRSSLRREHGHRYGTH